MEEIPNREQLKIQALTETIGRISAEYESRIADYRAEFTIKFKEAEGIIEDLSATVRNLNQELDSLRKAELDEDVPEEED